MGNAIISLQTKLDSLTALVQESGEHQAATGNSAPGVPTSSAAVISAPGPETVSVSIAATCHSRQSLTHPGSSRLSGSNGVVHRTARHFYGLTSPYFSLNMAQNKVSDKTSHKDHEGAASLASIDEDDSDTGERESDKISHASPNSCRRSPTGHPISVSSLDSLFQPPFDLTLQDAIRLVNIYQEVVGEFHPIVDINSLTHQAEQGYARSCSGAPAATNDNRNAPGDEDSYLTFMLVIAIALRAENTLPQLELSKQVYNSCFEDLNSRLVSPATNLKHVVVVCLAVRINPHAII